MAHPAITEWLTAQNPNFKKGVYLLNTYGPDHSISPAILKSDTSFSRKKLTQALQQINGAIEPEPIAKTAKTVKKHIRGEVQGYPDHLKELDRNLPILWSELKTMANSTSDLPEGDALKELALAIVDKHKEIRRTWEQLDYFAAYRSCLPGTEPQKEPETLVEKLVNWLELYPSLLDYSRRHAKSKDSAKREEAEARKLEIEKIRSFIKQYRNAA